MKTHDNQKPFQCTVCNRGYNTAAALTSHMQGHKRDRATRDPRDPRETRDHDRRRTTRCLHCGDAFRRPEMLQVIAGDTCSRCRARLPSEEAFLGHMARHHPALPAPCVVCRQTLASEAEARLHARFHLRPNDDEQRCAICLRPLTMGEAGEGVRACSSCYARHATPRAAPSAPPADHDCRLCRRSLGSPARLQAHLIEHTFAGIGAFTCYLCSAVFTSAAGLQRHLPEHAAAPRPYDCARCGLKFFFRAELDNHAFVHIEEAEIAQRAFYEAYARGAASAWAALAPPPPDAAPTSSAAEPPVKTEPEIKEERNGEEYIEVSSPAPPAAAAVKQERAEVD
ncbi:Zinc finger protein 423-like [Papilio machaon]|uniref:Zinc finger protein 423-like n=1 Tax=Papilio machaon TaxID=76193 RepID=A0A194QQ06_PAPMA|nr:Zinc finger protein 423-like [Papilio machaon]